jgi:hypothetical protein
LHRSWSGGLFGWRAPASIRGFLDDAKIKLSDSGVQGWKCVTYTSKEPFIPILEQNKLDSYEYQFLIRLSGAHSVLVGAEGGMVEILIQRTSLKGGIIAPRVFVDRLVTDLANSPDDRFLMGGVFARIEGYGNSLRSIALWGADVADAELFHRIRGNIAPYRVELRDVKRGSQILSISSRGELTFNFDRPELLTDITTTLKTLHDEGYIEWPK